ncbi:hypothetical protein [Aestuariivirga sp.]|nr:hypothetical protein [Aestuariivirga sp.]
MQGEAPLHWGFGSGGSDAYYVDTTGDSITDSTGYSDTVVLR